MEECEEVARTMLPRYLDWKANLPWSMPGHSMTGIASWVMQELRATESYVVIDNVTEHLQQLVLKHCGGHF